MTEQHVGEWGASFLKGVGSMASIFAPPISIPRVSVEDALRSDLEKVSEDIRNAAASCVNSWSAADREKLEEAGQ